MADAGRCGPISPCALQEGSSSSALHRARCPDAPTDAMSSSGVPRCPVVFERRPSAYQAIEPLFRRTLRPTSLRDEAPAGAASGCSLTVERRGDLGLENPLGPGPDIRQPSRGGPRRGRLHQARRRSPGISQAGDLAQRGGEDEVRQLSHDPSAAILEPIAARSDRGRARIGQASRRRDDIAPRKRPLGSSSRRGRTLPAASSRLALIWVTT